MPTPELFKRFATIEDFAEAGQEELEELIRSTGFYRNKAKNIIACARALVENFKGIIPQTLTELTTLPGVGRKTGSVLLGTAFRRSRSA